jgi:Leucine-rich repeat (LRR) protein
LPPEIGELAALTYMDLTSNALEELPDTFFRLAALETLYLSNNRLSALSERIQRLARLAVLHLHNNRFQSLPCNLGRLVGLRDLGIGYQPELRTLPPSLSLLRGRLKSLWFRGQNHFENVKLTSHSAGPEAVLDQLHGQLQHALKEGEAGIAGLNCCTTQWPPLLLIRG